VTRGNWANHAADVNFCGAVHVDLGGALTGVATTTAVEGRPLSSGKRRSYHGNRRMSQVYVHRLQLTEFFEHPGPVVIVSLGRNRSAKVVVESENIGSKFLRHFRVVALQLV
jgi:hypothetical protein